MREIKINGIIFKSVKECALTYGINPSTLYNLKHITEEDIQRLKTIDPINEYKDTIIENIEELDQKNDEDDINEEVITTSNANYKNKGILLSGDLYFLIDTIKKYKPKTINLIDFENVNSAEFLEKYTNNDNNFNVFFYNACIYSNKFYKLVKDSPAINFQVLTYMVSDQLVDKILLYYLGALHNLNININIVARDKGYRDFLEFINTKNISVDWLKVENNKELRVVRSLCNYLAHSPYIKSNRFYPKSDLKTILEEWCTKKNTSFSEVSLDSLIDILVKHRCMEPIHKNNIKYHVMIMDKINALSYDK